MAFVFNSVAFSLEFHEVVPGLKIVGSSIAFVKYYTVKGGVADGLLAVQIGRVDEEDLVYVTSDTEVPYMNTVASAKAIYDGLVSAGLTQVLTDMLAVNPAALSSVESNAGAVGLLVKGKNANFRLTRRGNAVDERMLNQYDVPAAVFDPMKVVVDGLKTPVRERIDEVIAAYQAADVAEASARVAADALEADLAGADFTGRITAPSTDNIIPFMYANQAAFPDAGTYHGAVAHSHADGAMYFAHGGAWHKIANDADLLTLSAALDAEQAARVANDATTLSSANTYTDTKITDLVNGADAALDTLKEIGDALASGDQSVTDALTASIATESTARTTADNDLDTRIDNLISANNTEHSALGVRVDNEISDRTAADTALQTAIDAVQADVDTNESDADAAIAAEATARAAAITSLQTTLQADIDQNESDADAAIAAEQTARAAADTALDTRVTAIEGNAAITDPTTATALAAVQSDVDTNEADADAAIAAEVTNRTNADTALSNRLDVLEADPTTAAAVAAVQTDVNQNEADADAAIAAVQADVDANETAANDALALKAPLADPDFTGVLEVDTNARLEFDSNLTKVHNVLRGTSIVIGNNITLNPAAADGRVEVEGEFYLRPSDLTNAADDTAAAAAGIIVGQVYRNGSQLMVRVA